MLEFETRRQIYRLGKLCQSIGVRMVEFWLKRARVVVPGYERNH